MTTSPSGPDSPALADVDRTILDLERQTFRYLGAKERAIRERTGKTSTQYHVRLNQLLEDPAALAYAPAVVNRLRGRRTSALGGQQQEGGDGDGEVPLMRRADQPGHG